MKHTFTLKKVKEDKDNVTYEIIGYQKFINYIFGCLFQGRSIKLHSLK